MLKKIDYKNKYFILQDIVEEDDIEIGEISKEEAMKSYFIRAHKDACEYYGIPPYIGDDPELKEIYK